MIARVAKALALVASFTDAWIETPIRSIVPKRAVSHLLQMRGLKLWVRRLVLLLVLSHLLQMRGLKQKNNNNSTQSSEVASFTDAWIETP